MDITDLDLDDETRGWLRNNPNLVHQLRRVIFRMGAALRPSEGGMSIARAAQIVEQSEDAIATAVLAERKRCADLAEAAAVVIREAEFVGPREAAEALREVRDAIRDVAARTRCGHCGLVYASPDSAADCACPQMRE